MAMAYVGGLWQWSKVSNLGFKSAIFHGWKWTREHILAFWQPLTALNYKDELSVAPFSIHCLVRSRSAVGEGRKEGKEPKR